MHIGNLLQTEAAVRPSRMPVSQLHEGKSVHLSQQICYRALGQSAHGFRNSPPFGDDEGTSVLPCVAVSVQILRV